MDTRPASLVKAAKIHRLLEQTRYLFNQNNLQKLKTEATQMALTKAHVLSLPNKTIIDTIFKKTTKKRVQDFHRKIF